MNQFNAFIKRLMRTVLPALLLGAAGLSLLITGATQAQTPYNVSDERQIDTNQNWNNYTINVNSNGIIDFRGGTTSTISNSTLNNNAVNSKAWWGQNVALLLSGPNTTLTMDNVTVNSGGSSSNLRNFVNIYENSTLNLRNSRVNMNSTRFEPLIRVIAKSGGAGTVNITDTSFSATSKAVQNKLIHIGDHPTGGTYTGGTLNLGGTNTFSNLNGIIYNNGTMAVKNGTTTFSNASVQFQKNGVVVESGVLEFNNTYVSVDQWPANTTLFTVKSGAELRITNGSEFNLAGFTDKNNAVVVNVESGGKLVVNNSTLQGGSWNSGTAHFIINGGTLEITNQSRITGITNVNRYSGNVIRVNNGTLKIENSRIYENAANNYDGTDMPWGIIAASGSTTATISSSQFTNNIGQRAGTLFAYNGATMNVTGSTFTGNKQDVSCTQPNQGGAAISAYSATVNLGSGNTFQQNTAVSGGAIRIMRGTLDIAGGNSFTRNEVTWAGGAVFGDRANITVGAATFETNKAYTFGGAICQQGGSLVLGSSSDASVKPVFRNNQTSANDAQKYHYGMGGAVAVEMYCNVSGNTCSESQKMTVEMYNGTFERNSAIGHGGAITIGYNRGAMVNYDTEYVKMNIHKGNFDGNQVTNNTTDDMAGGAIFINNNATLTMKRVALTNNSSNTAGGAIASCTLGKNYLHIREGAAIFGNSAGRSDASSYPDIYISDKTQEFIVEEKMYNGGLHRWRTRDNIQTVRVYKGSPRNVTGIYMGSDPTSRDITTITPEVTFVNNSAVGYPTDGSSWMGSGGAIGNNGVLKIGETGTSLRIVKTWNDNSDSRPNLETFLSSLVLKANGTDYPLGTLRLISSENLTYTYSASADINVLITLKITDTNTYEITIDGLPAERDNRQITWTLSENLDGYPNPVINGNQNSGFTIRNTRATPTPTATARPTSTPTARPTFTPTFTSTPVPTSTNTPVPTTTSTPVVTETAVVTETSVVTETVVPTMTSTPSVTKTPSRPDWWDFVRLKEMPKTGFSSRAGRVIGEKPLSLEYTETNIMLQIPSLSVQADIVNVPFVDDEYPIDWLGSDLGLLEGSFLPGEGPCVITGHNHISEQDAGPFALIQYLEEGDLFFVIDEHGQMQRFMVYANEKIRESDFAGYERIASARENSITLITCEDERTTGGYVSRRIVAAAPL